MSYITKASVTVTTDSSGDATGYIPVLNGRLESLVYAKTDYADTADFTITNETTGQSLWAEANVTASAVVMPRPAVQNTQGANSAITAGGEPLRGHVVLSDERIKIVVAQGGDTKTGTFTAYVS